MKNQRNKYGIKDSVDKYRKAGQFKQWTDFDISGEHELRTIEQVKTRIEKDQIKYPNFEFKHIKNRDNTYTIMYKG